MADFKHSNLMIQRIGKIAIVEFNSTSMLDQMTIENTRAELNELVEKMEIPKLIISFETVTMVSSGVLGILLGLQKVAKPKGGEIRVIRLTPPLVVVFQLTKIDKLIKVFKNLDEAMIRF